MKAEIEKGPCKKTIYIIFSTIILMLIVSFWVYIERHHCESGLKFVNKDFVCHRTPVVSKIGYAEIESSLSQLIEQERASKKVEHVAVYFRDLADGPIFGIDEYEDFAPASLLKLPLALAFMMVAEENPDLLSEVIVSPPSDPSFKRTFGANGVKVNTKYSIEDLLCIMIAQSDNQAYFLLYDYFASNYGERVLYDLYLELGILAPKDSLDEIISVRRYASILRGLYNVAFTSREFSEKILGWLALSDFKEGIVSGVPNDVAIAHKFGERVLVDGTKQLHDCGIVYYPDNPYLLCIMTHGGEFNDLLSVISRISTFVYREFDSRRL